MSRLDLRGRYSMLIQWSDEDGVFVVSLPDWEGRVFNPITHGSTYEEAARNGEEALRALVASVLDHHEELPPLLAVAPEFAPV